MNTNYSLQTFGEVVAITRKVIINDDLQAMTRIPRFWAWRPHNSNRTPVLDSSNQQPR